MCYSCKGVLLVFFVQSATTLGLNQKKVLQSQASWHMLFGFEDIDEEEDPIEMKKMTTKMDLDKYYDDFYNTTEWEESAPSFPVDAMDSLTRTNGSNNLCMHGHFVPEVIVIGGIKASTTSLCAGLRRSPFILWPISGEDKVNSTKHFAAWKEGHYFDKHVEDGISYMISDFKECDMAVRNVAVDGSARYSTDPYVPKVISAWYGKQASQLKFVLILREPLARLHSHYHHSVRDGWCKLHKKFNFSRIIEKILKGKAKFVRRLLWSDDISTGSGCRDFLEGSLYVNQLRNYFKYFQPSQFILVPFLFNVDPGHAGRPSKLVAETLWSRLGVSGLPGPPVHSNDHEHPKLEEDLDEGLIKSMRAWFDNVTGPRVIANLVRSTNTILYHYAGDPDDPAQISEWLGENW